jgi:iron complex transport system ATP-binding protein
MNSPLLSASTLSFTKNGATLLENIDFSISQGEVVGIIGPNGAGKSTLLKCLVGIYNLDHGEVFFEDHPIANLSHEQRANRLSYLAQQQQTAFAFTARQTIEFGSFSRPTKSPSGNEAERIASTLDITALLDRKMDELSGGESQLVHFARILNQHAPLMLLDEPTASLDIGHEAQLMNLLKTQCQQGRSALVAIHNLNIAAAFCDRLLLLNHGKLVCSGSPEEVITQAHMRELYDHQVIVSQNPITGTTTVLPMPERQSSKPLSVHLIGGAGSTVALCRTLLQLGVEVTGGVAHEQDSDTEFWQAAGVEHVKVPAFSAIDDDAIKKAKSIEAHADITILCEFPFGLMNRANLDLAEQSNCLWILKNAPLDPGRFAQADIEAQFNACSAAAQQLTTQQAITKIKSHIGLL